MSALEQRVAGPLNPNYTLEKYMGGGETPVYSFVFGEEFNSSSLPEIRWGVLLDNYVEK